MALTSGFFNSVGSDRLYSAEDMSRIFDGIINDGIFDSVGNHFQVSPTGTLRNITVGTGRAWFNSTWTLNDSPYPLTLENTSSASYSRIDAVCIKVDHRDAVRANSFVVIQGTQAANPVKPTITNDPTNGVYYHVLAWVTVSYDTVITAAAIENAIGTSITPYVTGILESTDVDELFAQWDQEFNDWWDTIKSILDTDTVTRLQNEIDHLKPSNATILKYFSSVAAAGDYQIDAILSKISTLLDGKQPAGNYAPSSVNGKIKVVTRTGDGSTSFTLNLGIAPKLIVWASLWNSGTLWTIFAKINDLTINFASGSRTAVFARLFISSSMFYANYYDSTGVNIATATEYVVKPNFRISGTKFIVEEIPSELRGLFNYSGRNYQAIVLG